MVKNMSFDPVKAANASGFPLQLAIMNTIEDAPGWNVLFDEHPWENEITGTDGFIDIVASDINSYPFMRSLITVIFECKRVNQTGWVFLVTVPQSEQTKFKFWETHCGNGGWQSFNWKEDYLKPSSDVSQYCAIPGKGDDGRLSILEKTAAQLIDSVEAFAIEEKTFANSLAASSRQFHKIYVPVIVTTANFFVINTGSDTISVQDGNIPEGTNYVPVDYIRFKKSLRTNMTPSSVPIEINHLKTQQTIFVVNSAKFNSFLSEKNLTF